MTILTMSLSYSDRDECGEGACSEECSNLPGSFECFCSNGFHGTTCAGGSVSSDNSLRAWLQSYVQL